MPVTADEFAAAVMDEAAGELGKALERITHCLDQLTDEQIWWRSSESTNSIANLVLHLCGNLGQWVVAGLGGVPDVRDRPQEFAERSLLPRAELLDRLRAAVAESQRVLRGLSAAELLRVRRIQGYEATGLWALFDAVPHFRGHTQEIVYRARELLGDRYRFAWVPTTKEQGAPA